MLKILKKKFSKNFWSSRNDLSLRYLQSALHLDLSRCQGRDSSSTVQLLSTRQLMISLGQLLGNPPILISVWNWSQSKVKLRSLSRSKRNQDLSIGPYLVRDFWINFGLSILLSWNNEHVIFSLSTRRPNFWLLQIRPRLNIPNVKNSQKTITLYQRQIHI